MIRLSEIGRQYRAAGAMCSLIPLYGFVDDAVFLTKSGAVGLVLALGGVDYEFLDASQREAVTRRFEIALRVFDEHTRLYQYVLKRNQVPIGDVLHPIRAVSAVLERRRSFLQTKQKELYTLSLY